MITLTPATSPVVINRRSATSGQGFALDLGVGAVINGWEVGFGANGIANRITWNNMEQTTYSLNSLLSGNGTFISTQPGPISDARVELPVDYRETPTTPIGGRYEQKAGRGSEAGPFMAASSHGGLEQRFNRIAVRGGARYRLKQWNPTGGIGFDFSRRVSLDFAAFGTSANIELKHQVALTASIRLNR